MAQFANTIGSLPFQQQIAPPPGWTKQNSASGNIDVLANAETQYSDRVLTFDSNSSPITITWDTPGVLGDSEILALMKFSGNAQSGVYYFSTGIRLQAGAESGYYLGFIPTSSGGGSQIRIGQLDNGGLSQELVTGSFTWTTETWYWIRMRATGTSIQAKVWAMGAAEPGSFTISGTDSTYSTGRLGFRVRSNQIIPNCANFWAASAGETAQRGNALNGIAAFALASTLKASPGVKWGTNKATLSLTSVLSARFVAKPVNIGTVIALASKMVTQEWVPTRWTAECVPTIQSSVKANAFIPYKTLPKHYEGDRYKRRHAEDYN